MNAAHKDIHARQAQARDNASWQDQIDIAISTADPILANLRITAAHYQLSLALRRLLGPGTEANFHTWATWGSKKAGQTIRQEDLAQLRALGRWGIPSLVQRRRDHSSRMILAGNITVLDDIGRQTARFICAFQDCSDPDPRRLADFLDTLRPGPTVEGGQDLLKNAFTHYYHAWHARSRSGKREHMLMANLYAILHEHIRLQPYIAGAMPWPARRLITRYLLNFSLGRRTMSVGKDVVPLVGIDRPYCVENAELRDFLAIWDRARGGVIGSRARNWADIDDRMAFICALFRTGHCDHGLFTAPYSALQWAEIEAGRIPEGPL